MNTQACIKNYSERKSTLTTDEIQSIIDSFSTLIEEQQNLNDLVWAVVDHVNLELNYEDCVIYLYDEKKESLIQMAAFGAKKKNNKKVKNPIRIEPGEGIVGRVFHFGTARIISDTSLDGNYIIDDRFRLSEISVPIKTENKVIGVIDSEHPSENYYVQTDQDILTAISQLMVAQMTTFKATD